MEGIKTNRIKSNINENQEKYKSTEIKTNRSERKKIKQTYKEKEIDNNRN